METPNFELPKRMTDLKLRTFADKLKELDEQIGFKVSARGWCYQMEQFRLINKDQFDRIETIINNCRKKGYLPIDFTAEEEGRKFSGVEIPDTGSPVILIQRYLEAAKTCENYYTPDWWDGEDYYIQMLVEKIDLKTLFKPVCEEYHIPIATSKGWSSMLQRATYAKRFRKAEDLGLKCVLLYCGDHDPDGGRISEFIRSNLADLQYIEWEYGGGGYDPSNLEIDRFGLNASFIHANDLSWIENLITGSGKDLGSSSHPNHNMDYVQNYIAEHGRRKCEANALVVRPEQGRELCRQAIVKYLGEDAIDRFRDKRQKIIDIVDEFRERTGLNSAIDDAIQVIKEEVEG